ncbi:MAG: disulfide bond formation protein B [Acidimicrobiales bacterium]
MPRETVTLFFALLACATVAAVAALGVALLVGERGRPIVDAFHSVALEVAAAVAVTATLGSLYLSEVADFVPCRLCWIQRGFMYPAAALLVAAVVLRRRLLAAVAGLLALGGLPVALFHRWEQSYGTVGGFCSPTTPCTTRWVDHFGFITIPTMAAAGFLGVASLVALHLFRRTP